MQSRSISAANPSSYRRTPVFRAAQDGGCRATVAREPRAAISIEIRPRDSKLLQPHSTLTVLFLVVGFYLGSFAW